MTVISDKAALALKAAITTRGKNKGLLLAKCPPSHTLAAAAWQGATLVCNPYKASIGSMLFMTAEQREIRDEIVAVLDAVSPALRRLDRDRNALETLGVW